jgi:hypothetical protein
MAPANQVVQEETSPDINEEEQLGGLMAQLVLAKQATCCGDSRSFRTQTMKENKSSRTKTKTQNQGQPKALFSTIDFSKVDPLYKCRSVSFYREVDGLFTS